jgi:hypothetical protein
MYVGLLVDLLDEVTREVEKETHRLGSGPANLAAVREAVQKNMDVKSWRAKFSGGVQEEEDAFDSTFAALITSAHAEIALN